MRSKERDRGWRRWKRRVVQRRRLKEDFTHHYDNLECAFHTDLRFRAFFADTPCRCSGPCCGNPRRHFGELTVQERKHELLTESES